MREEILHSWKRSREAGVNPEVLVEEFVSPEELAEIRQRRRHLIAVALPVMHTLRDFIQGSGSNLTLTDEQGIVLEALGDPEKNAPLPPLLPGLMTSESMIGTNGMGTCLVEDRPIQIWAGEHYLRVNHIWNCSAATIHDAGGNTIGCLNLSCIWEQAHYHTLGMILAAADAIEEQLRIEDALQQQTRLLHEQEAIFELIDEGILVIDANAAIVTINSQARMLLQTGKHNYIGRPISHLIHSGIDVLDVIRQGKNMYAQEASLTLRGGVVHCIMSTAVIGQGNGVVITLKENTRIRALINRVTGSKAVLTFDDILGQSALVQDAIRVAKIAGNSVSNTLILGEIGFNIKRIGNHRKNPFTQIDL